MTFLHNIGLYIIMLQKMFQKPTKWEVMKELILKDTEDTVINSLGIISFVSFFIGGVITIQLALSTTGSFYPNYLVGYATRETIILEFAPTIISIIMAGKVGSFITSSIGSMRVTEQIDALEVMGINSINYLVFPKGIALLLYPFLISIAMFLGILGGMAACVYGGYSTMSDFIDGIQTAGFSSTDKFHSYRILQKNPFHKFQRDHTDQMPYSFHLVSLLRNLRMFFFYFRPKEPRHIGNIGRVP